MTVKGYVGLLHGHGIPNIKDDIYKFKVVESLEQSEMKKYCAQSYRQSRKWRKDVKKRGKVCRECRNEARNDNNSQA